MRLTLAVTLWHGSPQTRETSFCVLSTACVDARIELWSAAQKNDFGAAMELLKKRTNIEERHQNWTPLMKASEENSVHVLTMLIEWEADVNATNLKGRTALSFAAAPSDDGTKTRPTALQAMRLLLKSGADAEHKDERGNTAKDYAKREQREDALAIFEELSF